jgi:polyisoprenoid-binding protein YceI
VTLVLDTPVRAGQWRIDPRRSTVAFSVRHLGVHTIHGRFSSFGGELCSGDDGVQAQARVDVASVDTGNATRDARLRSEFFDAERFPAMSFTVVDSEHDPNGAVLLTGELTIREVRRLITLAAVPSSSDEGALHLHVDGELSRSVFGLEWDALREAGRRLVADRVRLRFDLVLRPVAGD